MAAVPQSDVACIVFVRTPGPVSFDVTRVSVLRELHQSTRSCDRQSHVVGP